MLNRAVDGVHVHVVGHWRRKAAYHSLKPILWLDGIVPSMARRVIHILSYVANSTTSDSSLDLRPFAFRENAS